MKNKEKALSIFKNGYSCSQAVLAAYCEELGLEIIKKRNGFIDLVILDMIMPEMNGHECFVAMKKIKPDLKVIFSTGYMNEPEFERLKEEGIKTIILKPYRYSELSRVVAEALMKI